MLFKQVKNPNRPGRAPGGHEWVRDESGVILTNDKGEFAYQVSTGKAPSKKKTAGKKKTTAKKAGRKAGRKAVEVTEDLQSALLLKKTYVGLSSDALAKIRDITGGLIDKAKDAEKATLEKAIQKLQSKLEKL